MEKIKSFTVDHDILEPGIYLSRRDGDIDTYDLRFKKPNRNDFLANGAMHTIEHLFATYVRNSPHSGDIIYFGPMGCRTGFYFLVRNLPAEDVIGLIRDAALFIRDYDGEIPGARKEECGNYLEHDLGGAKREAAAYYTMIKDVTKEMLSYRD